MLNPNQFSSSFRADLLPLLHLEKINIRKAIVQKRREALTGAVDRSLKIIASVMKNRESAPIKEDLEKIKSALGRVTTPDNRVTEKTQDACSDVFRYVEALNQKVFGPVNEEVQKVESQKKANVEKKFTPIELQKNLENALDKGLLDKGLYDYAAELIPQIQQRDLQDAAWAALIGKLKKQHRYGEALRHISAIANDPLREELEKQIILLVKIETGEIIEPMKREALSDIEIEILQRALWEDLQKGHHQSAIAKTYKLPVGRARDRALAEVIDHLVHQHEYSSVLPLIKDLNEELMKQEFLKLLEEFNSK